MALRPIKTQSPVKAKCIVYLGSTLVLMTLCLLTTSSPIRRAIDFLQSLAGKLPNRIEQVELGLQSNKDTTAGQLGEDFSRDSSVMDDILHALKILQGHYFEPWQGTWPDAIDWTAAVIATQISGSLNAITRHPAYQPIDSPYGAVSENTISGYFTHITSFYFGENAFAIRSQAYDDMQWVVLGWVESIKTIRLHSDLHFADNKGYNSSWHGKDYIAAFAHRARIFWDLASKGWDTTLCGGGMLWSPYGVPYKNAITNELYIAASVSMYLYSPGDENGFPFQPGRADLSSHESSPTKEHDPKYLNAAIVAYSWLNDSNMTNSQGLYTDGFHILGWRGGDNGSSGTGNCDVRDEKVYSYNQGVILTGQRGLWEATGCEKYLTDGHDLVRNVIAATGYHEEVNDTLHQWAGLGRDGILEETCDAASSCTQNGQTFKGIFFHHLTTFCEPLPVGANGPVFHRADAALASLHRYSCLEYGPWIARNARAALGTRDSNGEFGNWWTVGLNASNDVSSKYNVVKVGTDYRNEGLPMDDIWRFSDDRSTLPGAQKPAATLALAGDPNNRGRGRTVETQSGGLAVLSALYRIVELYHKS